MTELCDLPATVLQARIAAGTTSAVALMESCLARIASREPVVQAFAHLDQAKALEGARRADAQGAGALRGLPLGVKDILDVAGMPTGHNSAIWKEWWPRADAACVSLARSAGAVVIGKTVTTEYATRHPGPTTNPHNPGHTPGGSSQGSAAGVAAGFFPFGFGTQTAGSVIRPAAYCGVVGYKPSYALIHRAGMKVMSEELDTIGVMARTVADAALIVAAMTGLDLGNPEAKAPRAPRLLLTYGPPGQAAAEPATVALMERAAAAARRAGAEVITRDLPPEVLAVQAAHPLLMNAESAQALAWELANQPELLSDGLRARLLEAKAAGATALASARATFQAARAAVPATFEGVDAILTPSAPGEAPAGLANTGDPAFNALWTSLHLPCLTVPAGMGPGGLPLGVQVVGRYGADRETLAWAEWVRAAVMA
jgi:amidase